MKKYIIRLGVAVIAFASMALSSCTDYLSEIPKGEKIPTTWEDFNAFIRNNYTFHNLDPDQQAILVGDIFKLPTALASPSLTSANYLCDESADRYELMSSNDKNPFFSAYEAIFAWNLIVDYAPTATDATPEKRAMLEAQGRVLRAMNYFYLANYFAEPYSEGNRGKLSVPLVTSSSVEAPSPQVTIGELYDFLVQDLLAAVPNLPEKSESALHPTLAVGYGMLARVYLAMGNYDKALEYSDLALKQNNKLYDWIALYNDDKARYDDPADYTYYVKNYLDPELDNVENYIFRYGSSTAGWQGQRNTSYAITPERASRFEQGDTRLLCHWKARVHSSGVPYYSGIYANEANKSGMRAPEMYYIKAECLARKGGAENLKAAMALVNTVRKTRILPEFYQDWSAATTKEAVNLIINDKESEYIQTQVIFCDYRRLNLDPEYAREFVRKSKDTEYVLRPGSHLWTMPFPREAVTNPGNGTITQNVSK